jgi:hypothetical protein
MGVAALDGGAHEGRRGLFEGVVHNLFFKAPKRYSRSFLDLPPLQLLLSIHPMRSTIYGVVAATWLSGLPYCDLGGLNGFIEGKRTGPWEIKE